MIANPAVHTVLVLETHRRWQELSRQVRRLRWDEGWNTRLPSMDWGY